MVGASWQYLYPVFPGASSASVLREEAPLSHAFVTMEFLLKVIGPRNYEFTSLNL